MPRRRPMAVRRSRRRARGSMATAPGLHERPVLRWWRRCFPDFARRRVALKDQRKMAPVSHSYWESTLPLTRSLSDFGNLFFTRWRASAARPIRTNKATANQSPVFNLFLEKSPTPKDGCASAMDCARTLQLCSPRNRRTPISDGLLTCS
jgi:hypothetical protein